MIKSNNFIEVYSAEDTKFCDDLINVWANSDKSHGKLSVNRQLTIDKSKKDSIDVVLDPNDPVLSVYCKELQRCVNHYIEKYKFCNTHAPWRIVEGVNIQYYPPGGGYKIWHAERGTCTYPSAGRHLVFMTYLNDVTGGGTEWYYQDFKTQAVKGNTVIWPADWTFTHRGLIALSEEKYIITGWFNFIE